MSYNRDDIKLSFDKDCTQFFVNKKKGIVCCVVTAGINIPYDWCSPVSILGRTIKGYGIAKCNADDVFDEERGKRIALAKAENDAYVKAARYLNENQKHLTYFISKIEEFKDKGVRHCIHNEDYIESVHNPEHPKYKTTVKKLKHGYTNGKPNFDINVE